MVQRTAELQLQNEDKETANLKPDPAMVTSYDIFMPPAAGSEGDVWTITAEGKSAFLPHSSIGDVVGPDSSTDNALARFDGTTGELIQNSVALLTDTGALSGLTELDVDNLKLDGNTLSSTNTNGNVALSPNGDGIVTMPDGSTAGGGYIYHAGGTDVPVADGGTGASNAPDARTNLGIVIGTDVEAWSAQLDALAALATNGLITRTAANTVTARSVAVTSDTGLSVSNGDGVAGNPTLAGVDATTTTKGVASFNTNDFTVTSGAVSVNTANVVTTTGTQTLTNKTLSNPTITGALSGLTELDVDNLKLDGNTLSSTNTNGNVALSPNGDGIVTMPDGSTAGGGYIYHAGGTDVPVTDGGTGASDATTARTNLGVAIGSNVQAHSAQLDALAALATTGLTARTGVNTFATRSLIAPAAGITITNEDGVSGNPTFALADDLAALEGLNGSGLATRIGVNSYTTRVIAVTADTGISVTSGNGVSGNPTLAGVDATTTTKGVASFNTNDFTVTSGAVSVNTTNVVTTTGTQTLTNKTLTNPTITNYTETLHTIATSGASQTLDLANGTIQKITLTDNCTITMPTATAGKSFLLMLLQDGSGSHAVTWTTVQWPDSTAPTVTTTADKLDIFSFVCDGTNWYGAVGGQNYL